MKNKFIIRGSICTIRWTNRKGENFKVLMDAEDAYLLESHRLTVVVNNGLPRARLSYNDNGKYCRYLARVVMDCPDDMEVDHIHHKTLDNRKSELRIVSHFENGQNKKGAFRNSSTGVRGLFWSNQCNKYRAEVRVNNKRMYLGVFDSIEEGALALETFRKKNLPFSSEALK